MPGSSRIWCLTLALPFTNPVSTTGVHCLISGRETAECRGHDCYWSTSRTPTRWPLHVWNGRGRGPWLHNRRRQSEITALCHLWQCAVAALDKTNAEAEWRISARSVTDFHWTGTDPIHSDRSRSRVSTKIGAFSNLRMVLWFTTVICCWIFIGIDLNNCILLLKHECFSVLTSSLLSLFGLHRDYAVWRWNLTTIIALLLVVI